MPARKKRKTIKKKIRIYILAGIVLLILALLAAYWYVNHLINTPYKGYFEEKKFVTIERGMSINEIIHRLIDEGVLENDIGFKLAIKFSDQGTLLKAGEYLFEKPMSPKEIYEKMVKGEVYYHTYTLIEGKDSFDIAEELGEMGLADLKKIHSLVSSPELTKDIDPEATNLEGYLFPDTYLISRTFSEEEIISMMIRNFKSKYMNSIEPLLKEAKMTLREVLIIASLIEKEASLQEERSLVSSVIHNRLKIKMGLHIDATIIYALKLEGRWDGNIRRSDKKIESPYNTYLYRGLPKTPICNPGLESIRAAIKPDNTKYLYYVSKNDGSHVFSTNIDDHNRAVYIWQKKYWMQKWREEKKNKTKPAENKKENESTKKNEKER